MVCGGVWIGEQQPYSDVNGIHNQCACWNTRVIRGWRCGFMLHTGQSEAEIEGGVERLRAVRQCAWFRRRGDCSSASAPGVRSAQPSGLRSDLMAGAVESRVEEVLRAAGWQESRSYGCA
jgi:hypothetical protein